MPVGARAHRARPRRDAGRAFRGPPVPRPGLRARRRAAPGAVCAGVGGGHRGRVPAGLRTGLFPGAPGGRYRGGERPGRRPDGRRGAGGGGRPGGHPRRREPRGPQGHPSGVLPGARRAGRDPGLRPVRASSRRPLPGPRDRRGARVDGGGGPRRVVRDRRRGEPRDAPVGRTARPPGPNRRRSAPGHERAPARRGEPRGPLDPAHLHHRRGGGGPRPDLVLDDRPGVP